ncbi:MAG: HPF/RaiA family ribosome-associated protein [Candidatus Staskawiczbacteria bacterium]|nr:HPF/RaiA family ribosome-associated protein [Candidatus Staskawiczbacteria bacterium]
MKIIIKTKNLDQSEVLNDFIEKKFFTLKKFIDILKKPDNMKTLAEVFVEIERETKHHRKGEVYLVKAQLVLPGKSVMAEARADDLFKAVVAAKDELKLEIEKYKVKKIDNVRREQRKFKEETEI